VLRTGARMRLSGGRRLLHEQARSPLAWICAAVLLVRIVGIGWGLPASDGWDNDGVAPRDFLASLVQTATPGSYATYPPLHLVLLAVVTAPVTLVALVRAPSLSTADVVAQMLHVPTMTTIAVLARLVSLVMSIGIVWAVAKIAEELRGERAGWCAAAFVGVNAPLTYYAHTTNLDVPYVFWGCLALLSLVRAVVRNEPRRLRSWAMYAAFAVGTKDQAYALYLLAAPAGLALWLALDPRPRLGWRTLVREVVLALGIAAGLLLVIDGVLFNPSGFRERVRFLLGPASQAYAQYTDDWAGRWQVVRDLGSRFGLFYPWAFAVFGVLGLAVLLREERHQRGRLVAGLLPLAVIASFTVAFNCVARRTDHRFELPQTILAAVYGGVALDVLVFRLQGAIARAFVRVGVAASFAVGLFGAIDIDVNLLLDPRYDAEAWLRAHVAPEDTIETYGLNVYMPRFPAGAHVVRVGPDPGDHRSPMPGVEEVVDDYDHAAARGPRFIVVSSGWVWRYLLDPQGSAEPGRQLPPTQRETRGDARASEYFEELVNSDYGPYRLAHVADWKSRVWPAVEIHASTSREIWIYEREAP
jgi:Dolichyl-phosphate-mannose-protein mannosyltransferase